MERMISVSVTQTPAASPVVWHPSAITRDKRQQRFGHRSCALWLTGLSGAGKSTLAYAVEELLHERDIASYVLDGDNIRHGLNRDLGFGAAERSENIRRIGEVSRLFVDAGLFVICAFISPAQQDRAQVRALFGGQDFMEIYVKCTLEECERRDPKGMYKKARRGEIQNFTGISAAYEPPEHAELVLDTERLTVAACAAEVLSLLEAAGYLKVCTNR